MSTHDALNLRHPYDSSLEPDMLSTNSKDSLLAQLRSVNHGLDEVQREFHKSKEELSEAPPRGSPFTLEIQDEPVPPRFRLPVLETYNRASDSTEHVAAF